MHVAASQSGIVTRVQAVALGVSHRQLRIAEQAGIVRRVHPSVIWIGSEPPPRLARVHAAVLAVGTGAVASHESSLYVHGVDHVPFEVAVSAARTARTDLVGVRLHRVGDLHPRHLTVVDGLPTTTVERALIDVASVFSEVRTRWLVDHLTITARRTSIGRIARTLRDVNRRGRQGIGMFTTILDARRPQGPTPRSLLERAADELLALTSLPVPEREYPLPGLLSADRGGVREFVDRAWPDVRLILEVDGRRWHARERDMAKDRRRDRQAAAAGWQTLRVLDEEIRDVPDEVVRDVVDAHADRVATVRARS